MSTSLSEQLKRLAVPQTELLQRDKKRPSLLFDPREAAGLKRETVYQIGLDGLEELITKNQAFEQFRNNIFHITSKKFERAVETAESNKKLNKVIRKFLLLLSPYFLLSCSHKALEWLINRYSIHEYNREDLLMTIIPYHESNIFVRVVQLMKFRDQNDSWFFLKSLQKPGVHLTKQNLLAHAASDVHFIKFTTRFILLLIKQHEKPSLLTVPFNFYCTVFAGALEYAKEVNEAQVTQMLPALLKGLNSDIPDFVAASYVILGRLVTKTTLTDAILSRFVDKIAEAKVESLKTETVLMLLVLYQSQTQYEEIPDEACVHLVEKEWLPKIVQDLNNSNCYIFPFLKVLVGSCLYRAVKFDQEVMRIFLKKLLATIQFEDSFMETFLGLLLDSTKSRKDHPEHIQKWLMEVLETLERQYPEQFDKEVYKILSTTQQGRVIKRRKSLQKILKQTMTARCKFDVLDKLYHPNAGFRREALQYLANNYDSLREKEKEMIKSSFVDRLHDDDLTVVHETLSLIKNITVLDKKTVKEALIKLAYKCQTDVKKWAPISTDIVITLCSNSSSHDWETLLTVFPYLLPHDEEELLAAKQIIKTQFVRENSLLNSINGRSEDCERFCNSVFDSLRNEDMNLVEDFIGTLRQKSAEERSVLNKYLVTVILSCILPENSPIETSISIVEIFVAFLNSSEVKYGKGNALFHKHIVAAREGKFHVEAFLLCLKNVMVKTKKPEADLACVDLRKDDAPSRYLVLLADTLLKNLSNHQKYIRFFVYHFCDNLKNRVEFILNLAVCNKSSRSDFTLECVNLVANLVKIEASENKEVAALLQQDGMAVLYLLALLLDKSEEVKLKTFEIMDVLSRAKKHSPFVSLFKNLQSHQEEILVDTDQVPLVLFNYLTSTDKKLLQNISSVKSALIKGSCCASYPLYLKAKILELLSHTSAIDVFEASAEDCLHLLKTDSKSLDEIQSAVVIRNLSKYQANIAKDIRLGSTVWAIVEACFKKDELTLTLDGKTDFALVLLLKQFDKEFFANLREEIESEILDLMIAAATLSQNREIQPIIRHIIKVIELDAKLILSHFVTMRDVQSPKLDPNKLKRRISVVPTVDILDTVEWKKGVTVLEFIQEKKKLRNIDLLIPLLFDILKKCLDFDEQVAVEYPKQLILTSILHFAVKIERENISETVFNIELIVQCIRASQNPQTHYCALLVLAFSADLFPSQVLHNVMSIFTFMGSSVLRHEDAYSFQIISKIIDTVIPILVKDGTSEVIAKVLRVFVDAVLDVPEHRRMPIYSQLLNKIGVEEHLYIFLLLIFESHVLHSSRVKNKEEDMRRLEVAASICREFSPRIVIQGCIQLMKYLQELPDEMEKDNESSLFDIHYNTPKQFRHYKYTLIIFVAKLLSSKEFVSQVAALDSERSLNLEQYYKDMIINVLTYIHRSSRVAEKHAATPHAKYWKIITHLSYDILDTVNALLMPEMFLLVIKGLMLHNFATVRRRSMELLNAKLQSDPTFFSECKTEDIYSLVPPLITVIKNMELLKTEEELIVQTALLSLKLLVKLLAEYSPKLVEILEFLTNVIKSGKAQNNVLASMLLCLAELCVNLRAHAISSMPTYMPCLLKILKQQKHQDSPTLLLLSCVTAIQKILETLPLFLSPYLEKLLYELSVLASKWLGSSEDERLQPVRSKLTGILKEIGSVIPSRVLIPVLGQAYDKVIEKKVFGAVRPLMEVLVENLNTLDGREINSNMQELTKFFLNALQFRADRNTSLEETNEVEDCIVKALTKLVLKLSESTFKPLYYKLFDWSVRHEVKTERLITFYNLSSELADSLKSLFVLFAGHILNNAAQILDACNLVKSEEMYFSEESNNVLLLEKVTKTLLAVFTYDSHKFVNKDRFQVLMQPLVDQLENTLGGVECLEKRNDEFVTPCIVQFAVATADDALWKQLNYQILLKMKHSSPNIRLISLHCLKEVVKQLGIDYLPLLPETIPVLAELLEDEEETVEKACRKAVQEMEKSLGEPIEKYFKM